MRALRQLAVLAVAVAIGGGLVLRVWGGPTRSVAAYCSYFYGQGSILRNQWMQAGNNANQDPLGALGSVLGAPNQLANFFHELSLRAPESIADDVQTLSDSYKQLADSEGQDVMNPVGGIASGFVNALATAPASERVDKFTLDNCGPPPGSTSRPG